MDLALYLVLATSPLLLQRWSPGPQPRPDPMRERRLHLGPTYSPVSRHGYAPIGREECPMRRSTRSLAELFSTDPRETAERRRRLMELFSGPSMETSSYRPPATNSAKVAAERRQEFMDLFSFRKSPQPYRHRESASSKVTADRRQRFLDMFSSSSRQSAKHNSLQRREDKAALQSAKLSDQPTLIFNREYMDETLKRIWNKKAAKLMNVGALAAGAVGMMLPGPLGPFVSALLAPAVIGGASDSDAASAGKRAARGASRAPPATPLGPLVAALLAPAVIGGASDSGTASAGPATSPDWSDRFYQRNARYVLSVRDR